jgi:hypothetical protein
MASQPAPCLAEDYNNTRSRGFAECMFGFVECIEEYEVFQCMFEFAESWARSWNMHSLYGPFNLDREDSRGLLIDGRDRPPVILCGHQPAYYQTFFEQYGLEKDGEDGLAYAIDLDVNNPKIQRCAATEKVRARNPNFRVRRKHRMDGEIDAFFCRRSEDLTERVRRKDIEALILPLRCGGYGPRPRMASPPVSSPAFRISTS